ncbi:MAG: hypothetical protein J6L64_02740 [Opitutales bacterium]|nr:hypothetical protein [Opitutales bacterium]
MTDQELQEKRQELIDIFFEDIAEHHLGANFRVNGKEFWISGIWAPYCPKELEESRTHFYQTTGHEDNPDTKLIRVFKDKFDLMENFKIDGKCLRQLVFDCEIEFIDWNV